MDKSINVFNSRLKQVLSASGVERGELARYLGVSVPTVSRWINGISTPNVYQFREIAHFFGMPYDWFLDDECDPPDADRLAEKLGLSPGTVEALIDLAEEESPEVLTAVDDAVCSVIAAISAMYDDLLWAADDTAEDME